MTSNRGRIGGWMLTLGLALAAATAAPAAQEEPAGSSPTALIRVRPESPDATDAAIARDQATQLALVKSDEIIRAALGQPDVAALVKDQADPTEFIRRRLRADSVGSVPGCPSTSGGSARRCPSR